MGDNNMNHKTTSKCTSFCYTIKNKRSCTKINASVNMALYYCFVPYPQVVQSPIAKYCMKISIDSQNFKIVVLKLSLKVFVG